MRIFARKTYEFDLDGRKFVTRPLEFMDLPDGVEKTLLFRLAVADGSIEVLDTARKQKQAEKGENKGAPQARLGGEDSAKRSAAAVSGEHRKVFDGREKPVKAERAPEAPEQSKE